MVIVKPTWFSH